jgi:tetratricopeptide (TPR) repeat protein
MKSIREISWWVFLSLVLIVSCKNKNSVPSKESINELSLKRGEIISCGTTGKQFGSVVFEMTCNEKVQEDFNLAIELLHSFEYDESEKAFTKIIDEEPGCAMAYWGVAMCNFHPLWNPPTEPELKKGAAAVAIAKSITPKSERESAYINAIGLFYKDWDKTGHQARCINFENAMEQLHIKYPGDNEAAIFYALALEAAAEPTDKTYANQKKAGAILNALYDKEPNHPGIIHYLIHTYDYPELAALALPFARKYAAVAPSSAHALHMPSHIFTRLGLWDECIKSNLESVAAAKCYAESAGIKGHWDEEFHGMDYVVYGYLQKGQNDLAKEQVEYLDTISEAYPVNFKVAYAYAAIPSRFLLENKKWAEAAALQVHPVKFPWNKFPWQEAIFHFTRLLGCANTGNLDNAKIELNKLKLLRDTLEKRKDFYSTGQVEIQIKTGEAWIQFRSGNKTGALDLMKHAADMEDSTGKHPVTPGEVLPARELLADMLLELNKQEEALQAYETVLKKSPNRFNSLYGAGSSAEKTGNTQKAVYYYKQLSAITDSVKPGRSETAVAGLYLKKHA